MKKIAAGILAITVMLGLSACKPEGTYQITRSGSCSQGFHKVYNAKAWWCVPDGQEWGSKR